MIKLNKPKIKHQPNDQARQINYHTRHISDQIRQTSDKNRQTNDQTRQTNGQTRQTNGQNRQPMVIIDKAVQEIFGIYTGIYCIFVFVALIDTDAVD